MHIYVRRFFYFFLMFLCFIFLNNLAILKGSGHCFREGEEYRAGCEKKCPHVRESTLTDDDYIMHKGAKITITPKPTTTAKPTTKKPCTSKQEQCICANNSYRYTGVGDMKGKDSRCVSLEECYKLEAIDANRKSDFVAPSLEDLFYEVVTLMDRVGEDERKTKKPK